MSAAEVWSYVQFALSVAALAWCLYLQERLERTEVRLAEHRLDTLELIETLGQCDADADIGDVLAESFPHVLERHGELRDVFASERAS